MRWDLFFLGLRSLAAIALLGLAVMLGLITAKDDVSLLVGSICGLAGLFLLLMAVLCIAPELIQLVTAPIRNFFDDLFYPRTEMESEAPNYTLARYYRKQRRHADAIYWYRRLLQLHPQELEGYLEGIATAAESGSPGEARRFYKLGLRKLKNGDARQQLQQEYEIICSRLVLK